MKDFISERVVAEKDGWVIAVQEFWVTPWDKIEEVILRPGPFGRVQKGRDAISPLLCWRNRLRDKRGPCPEIDGPAITYLVEEWINHFGRPPDYVAVARAMNAKIQDLYERDRAEAEKWLDELRIFGEDRDLKGEWLSPQKARATFLRFRDRWRNAP